MMKVIFNTWRTWRQVGRFFSTATAEKPKDGDGVEFFRFFIKKDNLAYAGIAIGSCFLLGKGYHLETDIAELKTLVKDMDKKLDAHFSILMALTAVNHVPTEMLKAHEKKDEK